MFPPFVQSSAIMFSENFITEGALQFPDCVYIEHVSAQVLLNHRNATELTHGEEFAVALDVGLQVHLSHFFLTNGAFALHVDTRFVSI